MCSSHENRQWIHCGIAGATIRKQQPGYGRGGRSPGSGHAGGCCRGRIGFVPRTGENTAEDGEDSCRLDGMLQTRRGRAKFRADAVRTEILTALPPSERFRRRDRSRTAEGQDFFPPMDTNSMRRWTAAARAIAFRRSAASTMAGLCFRDRLFWRSPALSLSIDGTTAHLCATP